MPQFLYSKSDFKFPDGVSYDQDKAKNLVSVYNLNLILINNYKDNEIRVCDIFNDKNNFTIYSYNNEYVPNIIFENLLVSLMNKNTKYEDILSVVESAGITIVYDYSHEIQKNKLSNNKKQAKPLRQEQIPILNINNISQKELSILPGISIVQAKKAVKYREENSGFKSKEEFYKILNLKQHYIDMIDDVIFIGEYNFINEYSVEEIETSKQEGRTVDFD